MSTRRPPQIPEVSDAEFANGFEQAVHAIPLLSQLDLTTIPTSLDDARLGELALRRGLEDVALTPRQGVDVQSAMRYLGALMQARRVPEATKRVATGYVLRSLFEVDLRRVESAGA